MADLFDFLGGALQAGASVYSSVMQAKMQKKAAKSQIATFTNDFPQLGMGLAATGPQRAPNPFYTPDSPVGQIMNYFGAGESMPGSAVSVRAPTQYMVYTTQSGQQRVTGVRGLGTPMLWSGDLAAVRRVARVARKLGRFVRHRRPR